MSLLKPKQEGNMLKVYGSEMCPDCIECKYNLDRNNIEYDNIDITKSLKGLKGVS